MHIVKIVRIFVQVESNKAESQNENKMKYNFNTNAYEPSTVEGIAGDFNYRDVENAGLPHYTPDGNVSNYSGPISITEKQLKALLAARAERLGKVESVKEVKPVKGVEPVIELIEESAEKAAKTVPVGQHVNSGLGFYMKNTKSNWDLCNKYGYDAIEKVE